MSDNPTTGGKLGTEREIGRQEGWDLALQWLRERASSHAGRWMTMVPKDAIKATVDEMETLSVTATEHAPTSRSMGVQQSSRDHQLRSERPEGMAALGLLREAVPPGRDDMSADPIKETTARPQAWPLYLPADTTKPARVARPFKDATGGLCYEWRYAGQPDRGGWMTRASWLAWVRRNTAQVTP